MQNKMKKEENYSPWEIRFLREGIFMPLGSLLNAWAVINEGKGKDIETFKKEAEELFELAIKFVEDGIKISKEKENQNLDFPKK
jgi:hypothetical protein